MSIRLLSRRIPLLVIGVVALVLLILTVRFRVEEQKLAVQNQKLLTEIHTLQSPQPLPTADQNNKPSVLLDAPITEKTALSFYWFGDTETHFRHPLNYFVVPDADRKLHKVEFSDSEGGQINMFVSKAEMARIVKGLKTLGLRWEDSRGREVFRGAQYRRGTDMLDITFVDSDATSNAGIRIAEMCDLLGRLDSTMPSPRILWQFRTFRWDNGCEIRGYENYPVPTE